MDIKWHAKQLMAKTAIRLLEQTGWYTGYWNQWRGSLFDHAERHGLHVLPVHFYTPIPDGEKLPESLWQERNDPPGVDLRIEEGLSLLARLAERYRSEYDQFPYEKPAEPQRFHLSNTAYSCGDAEILYSMIRDLKPRRIVEVGSGYTTLQISETIGRMVQDDPGLACEFTAIEPYPPEYLSPRPAGVTRVLPSIVQTVPVHEFLALEADDILFIDSSHVVAIGSDVIYLFLEILPRLAPGVVVHVHDVFIPFNYPRSWIRQSRFFWNEQYLLHAFLLFNQAFEVLLPTHAVFHRHNEEFKRHVPSCARHERQPSSFWMRRRGGAGCETRRDKPR
jgi:Methyltransferase domain